LAGRLGANLSRKRQQPSCGAACFQLRPRRRQLQLNARHQHKQRIQVIARDSTCLLLATRCRDRGKGAPEPGSGFCLPRRARLRDEGQFRFQRLHLALCCAWIHPSHPVRMDPGPVPGAKRTEMPLITDFADQRFGSVSQHFVWRARPAAN